MKEEEKHTVMPKFGGGPKGLGKIALLTHV